MQRDRYGLPLSTASEAAASAYGDGVDRLLAALNGAEEALDRAIAADPNFALAYIARARMYAVFSHGAEARAYAAQARKLATNATERERGHVHVIASAIEGKATEAIADAERHVEVYPRDALVLVLLLARSDFTPSRDVTIMTKRGFRSAGDWPRTMATTGGSWPISVGQT